MSRTLAAGYLLCIALLAIMLAAWKSGAPFLGGHHRYYWLAVLGSLQLVPGLLLLTGAWSAADPRRKASASIAGAVAITMAIPCVLLLLGLATGIARPVV